MNNRLIGLAITIASLTTSLLASELNLILPTKNHLTDKAEVLLLVKIDEKTSNCEASHLMAKLENSSIETPFYSANYPGEYYAKLNLPAQGEYTVKIQDSLGKCGMAKRDIKYKNLAKQERENLLLNDLNIQDASYAPKLSKYWKDSMLIMALAKLAKKDPQKLFIKKFLDSYFESIANKGRLKVNHPDHSPVVMGNLIYNSVNNTVQNHAIEGFLKYIQTVELNELGLVDHMGDAKLKRLGAKLIFNFLGNPESVWADSMMMYVLPSIMVGYNYPEVKVTTRSNTKKYHNKTYSLYEFGLIQLSKMMDILGTSDNLYKHSFDYETKTYRPAKEDGYWLRANGWAFSSMSFALDYLKEGTELKSKVENSLRNGLEKLLELRSKEVGIWRTMVIANDHPRNLSCYMGNDFETSGSSLIGLALSNSIKHGIFPSSYSLVVEEILVGLNRFFTYSSNKKQAISSISMRWMSGMTNAHKNICGYETWYSANKKNMSYGTGPYLMLLDQVED